MRTHFIIIFLLIQTSVFPQYGWSYDTIPDKKIVQTSIFRTEFKNGQANKDSVLIALRHYDNGLKVYEVYFGRCKDVECNDTIKYYYNAYKLLTKIIEPDYYQKSNKNTTYFWYDSLNNTSKTMVINEKKDIKKTVTYTRIYNKNKQVQVLYDTTTYKGMAPMASKTKFIYDDKNNLLKTLFYYQDTINGREGTLQSDNPNVKIKIDGKYQTQIGSRTNKKQNPVFQVTTYTSTKKDVIKHIDKYYDK